MSSINCARLLLAITLGVLTTHIGVVAQGQPSANTQLVVMSVIDVKPDLTADFGALQADAMAAQRAGGQAWRETWHTATFGHLHRVVVLSPVRGLDHFDGQSYSVKGVGAAAATSINERARRMIAHQQIYLLQPRADLGFGARPAKSTLGVVSYLTVVPGREADIEEMLKSEVGATLRKTGVSYYAVWRVLYGGETSQYLTLLMFENFADLGQSHVYQHLRTADSLEKLQGKLAGALTKIERHILRYNEALSFSETPQR